MNRYISIPINYIKKFISKTSCLMRRMFKYILIPFIGITVIIIAAAAFMIWRINPEDYRGMIENSLSKTLNAEVKIQGGMDVKIHPLEQSVLANQIVAKNLLTQEIFLEARQLFVSINLLNLVRNQVNIDKLKVVDAFLKTDKVTSEKKEKQKGESTNRSPELQIHYLSFQNLSIENTRTKIRQVIPGFTLTIVKHNEGSRINAELLYKNENVMFELTLDKPLRLDVLSNSFNSGMSIDAREIGTFKGNGFFNPSDNSFTGAVDCKLDNPVRLFKLLDINPVNISPLYLTSNILFKPSKIALTSLKLNAGGSNKLNGKVAVDWTRKKPRIDGVLNSPFFDVDEVFLDSSEILKEENMDYKLTEFNILNQFDSHLDVSIQYFEPKHGIILKDLHAEGWLANGVFSAVNVKGNIGGGSANGDLLVDATIPYRTRILLDLSLVNASVEKTILDFTNQEPTSIKGGTYTAKITLETQGNTPRELLAWDVNFEAELHESVLAKDKLQAIIGRDSFRAWKAKVNDINFTCALLRAKIDNGLLQTQNENIVVESDAVNIIGFAAVDFPLWTMEASVAMQPQKGFSSNISGSALNFVKAKGRINNPKIDFSLFTSTPDKKSLSGFDIIDKPIDVVKNISEATVQSIPFISQLTMIFKDPHPCKTAKNKKLPAGFEKDMLDLPIDESISLISNRILLKELLLRKKLGQKNF